jgi:tRNA pseudouridine38-40 synthase
MRNLKLVIAYDGTDFHGWQRQPNFPTVQALLEEFICQVIDESVAVHGSGRTDAGAHASGQVANFKTARRIPCSNLRLALNRALPPTVRIRSVEEVAEDFHARYSVRSKTYRYRILQATVCPPFLWRYVHQIEHPLDIARMSQAAAAFLGEHDFTSFAACEGEDKNGEKESRVRKILSSGFQYNHRLRLLTFEIRGSGFLYHMVRNLVGTLVQVGSGKRSPQDMTQILASRDRRLAGPTAPARGLCLVRVEY